MSMTKTEKRLTGGIITIILLAVCLTITTSALVYASVSVENNVFTMGKVDINLNDEQPVIEDGEFSFEPGMCVQKQFFLQNNSTCEVYFRIYFENVEGGLSDVLRVRILDGEDVLYDGAPEGLSRASTKTADDSMDVGEKRWLTIEFSCAENVGNSAQNQILSFDLCADAVQAPNNPGKLFD